MGLLKKIFGRTQSTQDNNLENAIDGANKIVNDYGDFMQSVSFPAQGCLADTKKLPYNKEKIKKALIISIKFCDDSKMKEMLKVAYVGLADFQDGVGEEDIGLDTRKYSNSQNIDGEKLETISNQMDKMMASFDYFKRIADDERQSLMKDVHHF